MIYPFNSEFNNSKSNRNWRESMERENVLGISFTASAYIIMGDSTNLLESFRPSPTS